MFCSLSLPPSPLSIDTVWMIRWKWNQFYKVDFRYQTEMFDFWNTIFSYEFEKRHSWLVLRNTMHQIFRLLLTVTIQCDQKFMTQFVTIKWHTLILMGMIQDKLEMLILISAYTYSVVCRNCLSHMVVLPKRWNESSFKQRSECAVKLMFVWKMGHWTSRVWIELWDGRIKFEFTIEFSQNMTFSWS